MKARTHGRIALSIALALLSAGLLKADDLFRTVAMNSDATPNLPWSLGTGTFFGFWEPGLNDAGLTQFKSRVRSGSDFRSARWVETPTAGFSMLAAEKVPVPGSTLELSVLRGSFEPANENGQQYFRADVKLPTDAVKTYSSLWTNPPGQAPMVVARSGAPAPSLPTDTFFSILNDPIINNNGYAVFSSTLAGAGVATFPGNQNQSYPLNNTAVWLSNPSGALSLIALEGSHPVGMPSDASFGNTGYEFSPLQINDLNEVYFENELITSTFRGRALLRYRESDGVAPLFKDGDQAPGLPTGVAFNGFAFQTDREGGFAMQSDLIGPGVNDENSTAIWAGSSASNVQLVARLGQQVPDRPGTAFTLLSLVATNRHGNALLFAQESDGSFDPIYGASIQDVLWKSAPEDGLKLVAREGQHAPGTPEGVVFSQFTRSAINDQGQVAFMAELVGPGISTTYTNGTGLWVEDRNGDLQLVARAGDLFDIDRGPGEDFRVIAGVSAALGGFYYQSGGLNNLGQVAFLLGFGTTFNSTGGVYVSNIGTVPEPGSTMLLTSPLLAWLTFRRRNVRSY